MDRLRRVARPAFGALVVLYLLAGVVAYWPGPREFPVAKLVQGGDRFISVDGLSLRYREYGRGGAGKPDLLLVHGFANSLQTWRLLGPQLAACCHAIAIDLPGFGLSEKPSDFDYRTPAQGERMVAAARALGLARPIYVGHSLGGAVALQAAVADPYAAGLVLLNPGILSTGVPTIAKITIPPLPRLSTKLFASGWFRERGLKSSYAHPEIVTPQVVSDVLLASRSEGYVAAMTSMMKQYETGTELPLLQRVHVPTLILWGDADRNKPLAEADELRHRIEGAQLMRFAAAGHYVHEEAADDVAKALRAWLTEHSPHP